MCEFSQKFSNLLIDPFAVADDTYYTNQNYADVGLIDVDELCALESEVLGLLRGMLFVPREHYLSANAGEPLKHFVGINDRAYEIVDDCGWDESFVAPIPEIAEIGVKFRDLSQDDEFARARDSSGIDDDDRTPMAPQTQPQVFPSPV